MPKRNDGSATAKKGGIKVKFFVYLYNGGDGSAVPKFYATEKQAQARSDRDQDEFGENFTEDVQEHEFVIDPSTGEILEGLEDPEPDDED